MDFKTVQTAHVPVRYFEGGNGGRWCICTAPEASNWMNLF